MVQIYKPGPGGVGAQLAINRTQAGTLLASFESDLGITLTSGKVSTWADQSGNSRNLTQTTAGNRPTYFATGGPKNMPYVHGDGAAFWMNSSYTLPTSGTAIAVVRNTNTSPTSPSGDVDSVFTGSATDFSGLFLATYNNYADGTNSGQRYLQAQAGSGTITLPKKNGFNIGGLDSSIWVALNEWHIVSFTWTGITSGSMGPLRILANADASSFGNNDLCALNIYSGVMTADNIKLGEAYLAHKYGIQHIATAGNVIITAGDSITHGYQLDIDASWPYQLYHTFLAENPNYFIYNEAVDGSSLIDVNDRANDSTGIDNIVFGGQGLLTKPLITLVVMAGTNDMYYQPTPLIDASACFDRSKTVITNRKATNKYDKIVIMLSIPRGNNTSAWYDYNQLIKNNWGDLLALGATAYIDPTTSSAFNSGTSPLNGTYYIDPVSDLTHPTKAGYTEIARIAALYFNSPAAAA